MGSGAGSQEGIPETSWVQDDGFSKAPGTGPVGRKRDCCLRLPSAADCEEQMMIHLGGGGSKDTGNPKRIQDSAKEDTGYQRPCYLSNQLFFPLARLLTLRQSGCSWTNILFCLPQGFVSGLQAIRTFNFTYISFSLCFRIKMCEQKFYKCFPPVSISQTFSELVTLLDNVKSKKDYFFN